MEKLYLNILIFFTLLFSRSNYDYRFIIFIYIALAAALLESFLKKKYRLVLLLSVSLFSFVDTEAIIFLPLFSCYISEKKDIAYSLPIALNLLIRFNISMFFFFYLCTLSMMFLTDKEKFIKKNSDIRDKLYEKSNVLGEKIKKGNTDRIISEMIAIKDERNRISRRLHDSIGHTLTSALLQIKAIKIINKDKELNDKIDTLFKTLDVGLTEIRKELYNIKNDSSDIKLELEKLLRNTKLNYKIYIDDEDMSLMMRLDLLSILKECITNTLKHGNADFIEMKVSSQKKFYSISVKDNSSIVPRPNNTHKGIGLISMMEIAKKYNGSFYSNFDNGFYIKLIFFKE